jgi:hypothetical protein
VKRRGARRRASGRSGQRPARQNIGEGREQHGSARHEQMMRAALGPLEELRRAGALDFSSQLNARLKPMQSVLTDIDYRFYLPEISETTRIYQEMNSTGVASLLKQYSNEASKIQEAMNSVRSPWADIENLTSSITGFAELQSIGHALQNMPSFDEQLADALRLDLGDWRAEIVWPKAIFDDPLARTNFYTAQGFNSGLTMFPSEAFAQGVMIAGLASPPPAIVDLYDRDIHAPDEDEEESGFARTNSAHDRLQRLETHMHQFIHKKMSEAFGEDWIKHRAPDEIRKAWLEKKQKARNNGEREFPLIAYADFTDYVQIITRNDNWKEVFKPVFRRKESVQESFQRLYPIRICTMHARIITQDDELYLYVEMKRLLNAIGIQE